MNRLRKIIFWLHLPVGVIAGVVILVMCVTGVLLTYEKQITSWADTRGYRAAPPTAETHRLPVLDFGLWTLDFGLWTLGFGFGFSLQRIKSDNQNSRPKTQDLRPKT